MAGLKSNKNRKYGRNKIKCKIYRDRGIRERNIKRGMVRHMKLQPNDKQTAKVLAKL